MVRWHFFRIVLGGLLVLVLFVNIYFIRVIVQSSSNKFGQPSSDIGFIFNSSNLNSNKKDNLKSSNTRYMEAKIHAEIKKLAPKYHKHNASSITILNNLMTELLTNRFIKDDLWKFPNEIWPTAEYLLPKSAPELGAVLDAMRKAKVLKADNAGVGTQLKLLLTLQDGVKALFKPQWYTRNTIIEGPVYHGKDRHNAEVVAFHLSSLLALRRTPLVVIRTLNLKEEVRLRATPELLNTMYQEGNNSCLYGVCHYCSITDPICASGDLLEGALILWLPANLKLIKRRHPWQRVYKRNKFALWETDDAYCEKVKLLKTYSPKSPGKLLNIVDAAIFDFLMDNGDRHHYESFERNFKNAAILLIDNGKSLGNPNVDHYDILSPLYQCCIIRKRTWERLIILSGGALSRYLSKLLTLEERKANVLPLITNDHLNALDRRLLVIYAVVEMCIKEKKSAINVILD